MNEEIKEVEEKTSKFTLDNTDFIKKMTPEEANIAKEILYRYAYVSDDFFDQATLQEYKNIDIEYLQESQA